ncbi:unnamed protein product [Mytilus coruscus]|uniref:Zinc finger PHD-type domain-containing protein n=1 Tax=Mytilus coruscus TaxID=42192 RepID=A0A6J7ZXA0_MYTCO|nr:unnamed protein product [Mytilus coruscus]
MSETKVVKSSRYFRVNKRDIQDKTAQSQPIIISDSKGNYIKRDIITEEFLNIKFITKKGQKVQQTIDWAEKELPSICHQHKNITFYIWLRTCNLTELNKTTRYISLVNQNDSNVRYLRRKFIELKAVITKIKPKSEIIFLEVPPYSIQCWNRSQGHKNPDIFSEDDQTLQNQLYQLNTFIQEINQSAEKSPKFDLDIRKTSKRKGGTDEYYNFNLYKTDGSIQTRTSARTKSKPQPYTPAKYENFSINKTRALDKKLEACNRTIDIKIEQKHQNYILELSAAAYEIIKGEIDIYFEQHSTYKLLPKHQHDNQGLCIRTSLSVRNRSSNRQLYRINLFHTTSKVEVNGQGMELFLTHIEDIKERMKSRGNYKIYNKQIEEQINIIKRNEADIEIRAKQNESLVKTTVHQPKTNHSNRILVSKGAECIQNTDEKLLSNWNRAIEWSEDEPTPSQDTSAVSMSTIHNYCAICNQTAQPEISIDCIACGQLFHYTCENIDPVRISQTEEEQYSCRSCSIMDMDVVNISTRSNNSIIDTEETIPKVSLEEQGSTEEYSEMAHIVKNAPDNTSKDCPTRNDVTKEEAGNANTEELEMNKMATYKQPNQILQNGRNEQIENVDEPKNMKAKQKRQYKCKNINETTQQLEDQLAQCRARLVIMEDTNRDYQST